MNKNFMVKFGFVVLAIALMLLLMYSSFKLKRWWNWEMSYNDSVQEMICDSIKPEYIIEDKCGK